MEIKNIVFHLAARLDLVEIQTWHSDGVPRHRQWVVLQTESSANSRLGWLMRGAGGSLFGSGQLVQSLHLSNIAMLGYYDFCGAFLLFLHAISKRLIHKS